MRTRAERRHNDWRKAKRKWRMDLDTAIEWSRPNLTIRNKSQYNNRYWLWYDNLHQYSKNKIHCSCAMCACKSKGTKVKKCTRGPATNWSISDKRKIDRLNYS